MRKLFSLLILALLLQSCTNKNASNSEMVKSILPHFDIKTAKEEIQKKTNLFTQAHIIKDTAYLNNTFCDDAKVFPPNNDLVSGRKAIAQLNFDWVNYGVYEFKEVTTSFYGNQDYLIDEGEYFLVYGKEKTIDKGKYINIWKNVKGEWKLFSNIWNSNLSLESAN